VTSTRNRVSAILLAALPVFAGPAGAAVEIEGLDPDLETHTRAALSLDNEACDAPDWRVDGLFGRATREIRSALQAYGYYAPEIEAAIEHGETCWTARFTVVTGEPVLLRDVTIELDGEAAADPDFARVLAGAGLRAGIPLHHGDYERLKTQLFDMAQRNGYAEARLIQNVIDVYPAELAADIRLRFDSGPRYAFGEFLVRQQILNPELVEGFYDIETGDPFDRRELTELYAALVDSGYFSLVSVRPLAADRDLRQIPIEIELTPGNRRILSYGGGFATDTGPRARIARTNRRLNERGAQLNLNTELSPVISEFSAIYRFPYGDPRTEWLSFDAGIRREDTETTKSDAIEFGVRRVIERSNDWQETQFVDLLVEDFEIQEERGRTTLLQPGISWLRVRADNTIRPDRGDKLSIEISGASDSLGSQTTFLQTIVEKLWIRSFATRARVLARVRAGITWEDNFDDLPPSVRFFAGGDNSIRGYKFRSLGPRDADGDVIGGSRLAVASIELERSIKEKWSVATFYDVGNAFRETDFEAVAGAGIGTRWLSPVGPIRIDVARPLDGPNRDLRLHVSLGPDL
jgi:translocation and assembly module TamA